MMGKHARKSRRPRRSGHGTAGGVSRRAAALTAEEMRQRISQETVRERDHYQRNTCGAMPVPGPSTSSGGGTEAQGTTSLLATVDACDVASQTQVLQSILTDLKDSKRQAARHEMDREILPEHRPLPRIVVPDMTGPDYLQFRAFCQDPDTTSDEEQREASTSFSEAVVSLHRKKQLQPKAVRCTTPVAAAVAVDVAQDSDAVASVAFRAPRPTQEGVEKEGEEPEGHSQQAVKLISQMSIEEGSSDNEPVDPIELKAYCPDKMDLKAGVKQAGLLFKGKPSFDAHLPPQKATSGPESANPWKEDMAGSSLLPLKRHTLKAGVKRQGLGRPKKTQ